MSSILIIIHVIVCIALILIVLLQSGKGSDMGATFGGGSSQTLFGSSGTTTFLTKLTTVAAIIFILTSLTLAYISTNRNASVINLRHGTPAPVDAAGAVPAPLQTLPDPVLPQTQSNE